MRRVYNRFLRCLHVNVENSNEVITYDYDQVWRRLIQSARKNTTPHVFDGAFVDYDDSPRRGCRHSRLLVGGTPEKFRGYLRQLIDISRTHHKEYIFLTAWNEWGESAYLEPDEINQFEYLQAIKDALSN